MPWRVAWALVQMLVFAFCGIVALTTDEAAWLNGSLRAGLTLFFFTNAVFPMVPQYGLVGKLLNISRGRSLQLRWTGLALSFALVCIGAAMTRTAVGYLVAACAFFGAWVFGWVVKRFGPLFREAVNDR